MLKKIIVYFIFFLLGVLFTANNPEIFRIVSEKSEEVSNKTLEKIGKKEIQKETEEEKED